MQDNDKTAGQPAERQPPAAGPVGLGDALPSNTASHGYKGNEDKAYQGFRIGVDSLYLSFHGDLLPSVDHGLALAKYAAQSKHPEEQAQAQWTVGKRVFEVSDKGRTGYAYILRDNGYQIALRSGGSGRLPVAYVQVSSELLAHQPLAAIFEDLRSIIEELAEGDSSGVISRIDIYADFETSTDIGALPREAWIGFPPLSRTHLVS